MTYGPSPETRHPISGQTRLVYLKTIVTNPNILVGDYTYYDDFENPENFERNVLYHFDFIGDRLIIGKFCAITSDVKFIMNGGNHRTDWFTNYPFPVFGHGWESAMPTDWPKRRHRDRQRCLDRLRRNPDAGGGSDLEALRRAK